MEWFYDWTSYAWLFFILGMIILEVYTIATKKAGDTLTEHFRRLLGLAKDPVTGMHYRGGVYGLLRFAFLTFFVWFIVHILFGIM